ncbi:MAG: DUF373 family protein [Candidatus Micrarchaeia archaeon]
MTERILVLAVDIDNDLYRKTKISGPVIGRKNNLSAAAKLTLADPMDADGNVMFEAVKKYDDLKKEGYQVSVATVTGSEKEGYSADLELVRQIEKVLGALKADSCVLVTDGASDERIIPLLKARIKINSVDFVSVKQAAQFERTYFTLLEKLKEPHYARIVFGIPAVLLLLFSLSYYLKIGFALPLSLIGVYLLLYAFGLWDVLTSSFKDLGFSIDRVSFIFYMASILFTIIALVVSYGSYMSMLNVTKDYLTLYAYAVESFLEIFSISMFSYFIGKLIDFNATHARFKSIELGGYMGYIIITTALVFLVSAWFTAQIYFWELLLYSTITILLGYGLYRFSRFLKKKAIKRTKMINKNVVTTIGSLIGKIVDVNPDFGFIKIKTEYGTVIKYDIDRITDVSDRVIVR